MNAQVAVSGQMAISGQVKIGEQAAMEQAAMGMSATQQRSERRETLTERVDGSASTARVAKERRFRTIGSDTIGFDTVQPGEIEFPGNTTPDHRIPGASPAVQRHLATGLDRLVIEQVSTSAPPRRRARPHAGRVERLEPPGAPRPVVGNAVFGQAIPDRAAPAWAANWATLESAVELDDWVTFEDVLRGPSPSAAPVIMTLAFLALLAVFI